LKQGPNQIMTPLLSEPAEGVISRQNVMRKGS
jgi:hypothetical protein